jgi:hypothetical protein
MLHVFQLQVNFFIILNFSIPFTKNQLQFYKSTIWVISHIIVTQVRHSIFEGKTEQINNLDIIYFNICFNNNFKHSDMNI